MYIGRLQQRVELQQRSTTLDAYGQQIPTWTTLAEVWANIKPLGGSEKLRAMVVESTLSHLVTVRYNKNFMPPTTVDAWRIKYGTRLFNIIAARNIDEANKHIEFQCDEGSLDGQ